MTTSETIDAVRPHIFEPEYVIDQGGLDGRFRVWWNVIGRGTCEREFSTRESAERWVDFMESLTA
jgi:hypothetical protein